MARCQTRAAMANVILGSLSRTTTSIDPLKEFKETWEAAAEEAYE